MESGAEFHWGEGMKYALEGIKSLFLLNGVATISILTFIGNVEDTPDQLILSMICFALGAATGPAAYVMAYLTELHYGNAKVPGSKSETQWRRGSKFHSATYFSVIFGLILFLLGVFLTGCALKT